MAVHVELSTVVRTPPWVNSWQTQALPQSPWFDVVNIHLVLLYVCILKSHNVKIEACPYPLIQRVWLNANLRSCCVKRRDMNRTAPVSQEVALNFHWLSFIIKIYLFLLILTMEKYNSGKGGPKHSFLLNSAYNAINIQVSLRWVDRVGSSS